MAHFHGVIDADKHFVIDAATREITNQSDKITLMQNDHNSERFTFEIPREIDGHDMSLCNVVRVHYLNIDTTTKAQNPGFYEVEDLQISPDDETKIIGSWLISANATKNVGNLNFTIRFKCIADDGVIEYAWSSAIFKGISVGQSYNNAGTVAEEYADIFAQWQARIEALEQGGTGSGSGLTDEQAAEIAANTEARHEHGNKTVSVPADEVSYTHNNIQDTSGTVKGALDEAIDYVTGTVAKLTHSHSNKEVLDRFSEALGDLYSVCYNGVMLLNEYHLLNYATKQELQNAINGIGGSTAIKVMSFAQYDNSDIMEGHSVNEIIGFIFDSEDMSKNPLPENAIVVDVGIVLNDDTEIRKNQMWNPSAFGSAIAEICNTPVYDETYCYPVLRVVDTGKASFTQPLFGTIMSDGYKQFNVYYI